MSIIDTPNWLMPCVEYRGGFLAHRPRVVCIDGYSISIQANEMAYSMPRADFSDYYFKVELGYPSSIDDEERELLRDYVDIPDEVWGYVPNEVVDKLIEKHGGVDPEFIKAQGFLQGAK